jgi:hypothetical protein
MRTNGTDTLSEFDEREARTVQSEQDALARDRFATPDADIEECQVKQSAVAQLTPAQAQRRGPQWSASRQLFMVPMIVGLTREQMVYAENNGDPELKAWAVEGLLLDCLHHGLDKIMRESELAASQAAAQPPF